MDSVQGLEFANPLNTFVMLNIRFSKHLLVKFSLIYVYIKCEAKKNIIQQQCLQL